MGSATRRRRQPASQNFRASQRNRLGILQKWHLVRLVYAEPFDRIDEAIAREKALKKWNRVWKLRLISEANPEWSDLFETING